MAEIRVEEKNYSWIWWVLGVLIVAAIIWFLVGRNGDDGGTAVTTPVDQSEQTATGTESNDGNAYLQYSRWVREGGVDMDKHHEATSEGIQSLANALRYTADQAGISNEADINSELDKMNTMANEITNDPQSTDHANKIRTAFTQAASITGLIQERKNDNLYNEVQELRNLANEVDPNTLTLNQKENIKAFFEKADEVLIKMNS